jgi:hypothetical protein
MASVDVDKITTAEDLLEKLRRGNSQVLEIGLGELKVPCRLLSATEEALVVAKANQKSIKDNPQGLKKEIWESINVMKGILKASTTIDAAGLPDRFFEELRERELTDLYDQYVTLNHTINPNIQDLSPQEILQIVEEVKKKGPSSVKNYFGYQLAAIGKLYLTSIATSQTANELGTQS